MRCRLRGVRAQFGGGLVWKVSLKEVAFLKPGDVQVSSDLGVTVNWCRDGRPRKRPSPEWAETAAGWLRSRQRRSRSAGTRARSGRLRTDSPKCSPDLPRKAQNSRVLKWIFEQCDGTGKFVETEIGIMPTPDALDAPAGVTADDLKELLTVDREGWKREIADVRAEHYPKFGEKLPKELWAELEGLEARLK